MGKIAYSLFSYNTKLLFLNLHLDRLLFLRYACAKLETYKQFKNCFEDAL